MYIIVNDVAKIFLTQSIAIAAAVLLISNTNNLVAEAWILKCEFAVLCQLFSSILNCFIFILSLRGSVVRGRF